MPVELLNDTSNTSEDILVTSDDLDEYLEHHGTKGQKWGFRRYQNPDGSLTEEGRKHYGVGPALSKAGKNVGKAIGKAVRKATGRQTDEELDAELAKAANKKARQEKKELIDELNGKHKKLSEMSDDELDAFVDRKIRETRARQVEKELREANRGEINKFIRASAKTLATEAVAGTGRGIAKSIENTMTARAKQKQEQREALKDQKFRKKLEQRRDKYETEEQRLLREADNAKLRKERMKDNIETEAYRGDKKAQETLRRSKNSWDNDDTDPYKIAAESAKRKREMAEEFRKSREESLRTAALAGDKDSLSAWRSYNEASSGRSQNDKRSKAEKRAAKAKIAAETAEYETRRRKAEAEGRILEGDKTAEKRRTALSDANKGTPKPKNNGDGGKKPQGNETDNPQTPKKEQTPKKDDNKEEKPGNNKEENKYEKAKHRIKHDDFSSVNIDEEYFSDAFVDSFILYHSETTFH